MNVQQTSPKVRKGFTLVELAVVIVIIGVLAAFGVPKFLNSVERSKAAEAFAYLAAVRTAQERYIARQGVYTEDLTQLDIAIQAPKYFTPGTITSTNTGTDPTWTMTLTRIAATSSKGAYTVTFTQEGFDPDNSTILALPEINPSGTTAAAPTT
ncbi:type IV pilin protein [Paludisphaera mucosa]|uniref:Prepilin-type N-terminal cleavage/methylation domain-containing protein n=1 Tax=Paludisphaera mucosa TaxID=3030827 RepID=A0ABT6FJI6_9BACT|nr:prepilin-type N-terminal cleavage/methylation domain-containing protein [Paludisphaera mucosa]MDG3007712.1 prepilin-type N-terminal cleavage/methylation domain-containing protein [Paludisphaera mucosa]